MVEEAILPRKEKIAINAETWATTNETDNHKDWLPFMSVGIKRSKIEHSCWT